MKPQAGKRYVRADGEITDYLVHKRMDCVLYLYDKYHDAYYITTGDLRTESEATDPSELVAEYEEPKDQDMADIFLESGKRYIRADGEITGKIVDRGPELLLRFRDEKNGVNYNEYGFSYRKEHTIISEYEEQAKTVKRWQWVAIALDDGNPVIFGPSTEQEAVFVSVSQRGIILLIGRIQESLIETEE